MKKAALGMLCVVALAGCGSKENDMEVACKELLEISSANPRKVQINKISMLHAALKKEEAIKELEFYYKGPIGSTQLTYINLLYGDLNKPPRQYFVSIDYTDEGGLSPKRGEAVCRYYVDSEPMLIGASLNRGVHISSRSAIMDFLILRGRPKNMDTIGKIEK